jgi:hypothetical protein
MTSEQVYMTGLSIMKDAYWIPMKEKAGQMKHSKFFAKFPPHEIVSENVVDDIFLNIHLLNMINDGLCTAIEQRLEAWGKPGAEENLGDIFKELARSYSNSNLMFVGAKIKGSLLQIWGWLRHWNKAFGTATVD